MGDNEEELIVSAASDSCLYDRNMPGSRDSSRRDDEVNRQEENHVGDQDT